MKTCHLYLLPFLIYLLIFSWVTIRYIFIRSIFLSYIKKLGGDEIWNQEYVDLNYWLKGLEDTRDYMINENDSGNPCEKAVIHVPPQNRDNPTICRALSRKVCGVDSKTMMLVQIPEDETITFFAANGMQLLPGEAYCVYKVPPPFESNNQRRCHETWGFWKYSPIHDRWMCYSKVPGVYNAETNKFDPCQRENKKGKFLVKGKVVANEDIEIKFSPEDFHSLEFQSQCECECNKFEGLIFNPALSRTSCFKDPCLAELPIYAAAPGFNTDTGNCDCGAFFTNLFNDPKFPCTACPYDWPVYDKETHTLTIYVKCYNEEERGKRHGAARFGLIPCQTDEEKIKGCTKAILRVKPMSKRYDNISEENFEERVFW